MTMPSPEAGRKLATRLEREIRDRREVTDGRGPKLVELRPEDVADLKAAFGQGPTWPPRELFGVKLKINTFATRGGQIR